MTSRTGREMDHPSLSMSAATARNSGPSLDGIPPPTDDCLDLFSRSRRSVSSSDAPPSIKLGRLSLGSAKVARAGIDDLLSSAEGGKNDYDWLLTPPGTPLFDSSDGDASQPTKGSLGARSTSVTKASRLSVSQSESNHSSRPVRSSSVTRSSISTSLYNTYSSNRSSSSIMNTSYASVSRPSSPIIRSSSSTRPSTSSARATVSQSSTPSRVRPTLNSFSTERPRPSVSSRPSTPSSRQHILSSVSSPAAPRQSSCPSTPTRRSSTPSLYSSSNNSTTSRSIQNGRASAPTSRPSSPSPRPWPPPQLIVPPDFPLETPPNLRTTLPDRPLSASRSRSSATITIQENLDTLTPTSLSRRQPLPVATRGRLSSAEPIGKTRGNANGRDVIEHRKYPSSPELGMRKPAKSVSSLADRTEFGWIISKNSLDMAIRHMDIRNGTGSIRSLSATTLFPQSIRSTASKTQSNRAASALTSSVNKGTGRHDLDNNCVTIENIYRTRAADYKAEPYKGRHSAKVTDIDISESSRYDAILLREDLKNSNWLHSFDDKSDQGPIFENGLEYLPEPFAPL